MMDKDAIRATIAARAAKELHDGDVVNLGIGIPTEVTKYLPEGVTIFLQSENGIIGTGATPGPDTADLRYYTDAGRGPATVAPYGAYIDSATSFSLIRGGHVDVTMLGALEVDQQGNLANWIIPGIKFMGMGGAMDLVNGAKKVIVTMEHTVKGAPKILEDCYLPLTGEKCVDMIITEMGVMTIGEDGITLIEINPEFTVEEVQDVTEAKLIISPDLKPMC